MASASRQEILDALGARLALVAPGVVLTFGDGTTHTCTTTINDLKEWRRHPYAATEVPACAYRDGITRLDPLEFGLRARYQLRVLVAVYLTATAPASAARAAIADILAAVGTDQRLGGICHGTDLVRYQLMLQHSGDVMAAGLVELLITYTERKLAPGGGLLNETGDRLIDENGNVLEW